jgi:3-phytase
MGSAMPSISVPDESGESDMDDPAIWIPPAAGERGRALVVAAAKRGGMRVYDLGGRLVQRIDPARDAAGKVRQRFNNVDIQYGFRLAGQAVDIAVASDRIADRLRIWRIDPAGAAPLVDVTDPGIPRLFANYPDPANRAGASLPNPDDGKRTAYGLALYRERASGRYFALVTQAGEAVVTKWELVATPEGRITARFSKEWRFPYTYKGQDLTHEDKNDSARSFSPQFEGLAVDQQAGIAYAGQEDVGIWRIHLRDGRDEAEAAPFAETRAFDPASRIARDVEGLSIYYGIDGAGYLIASSQGAAHGKSRNAMPDIDDSFAVFAREAPNRYLGSFRLLANAALGIDGVQECDGADVTSLALPGFPGGMFVTQDGYNGDRFSEHASHTNLKFTPWQAIANGFPGGLATTTNYDPRNP